MYCVDLVVVVDGLISILSLSFLSRKGFFFFFWLIENTQTSLIIKIHKYIMEKSLYKKIGTLFNPNRKKSKMPKACLDN